MGSRAHLGPRLGRRGSGSLPAFTPASLGSDLKLWLRADLGLSVSVGDVLSWTDQASGTVWTPVSPPMHVPNAINGRPGVSASTAAQACVLSSGTLANIPPPWTWVAVYRAYVTAGDIPIFVNGTATNSALSIDSAAVSHLYTYSGPVGAGLNVTAASQSQGSIARLSSSGVTPQQSINGVSDGLASGGDVTLDWGSAGSKICYTVATGSLILCEFLLVARSSNLSKLNRYFKTRYGLVLS